MKFDNIIYKYKFGGEFAVFRFKKRGHAYGTELNKVIYWIAVETKRDE